MTPVPANAALGPRTVGVPHSQSPPNVHPLGHVSKPLWKYVVHPPTAVPLQTPAVQLSPVVQLSKSLQAVPFMMGIAVQFEFASQMPTLHSSVACAHMPPGATASPTQDPFTGLHTPLVQFTVNAEQSFAAPPWHAPARQVLPVLQRSPESEQALPFLVASGVGSHAPLTGLQATELHSPSGEKEQSFGVPTQAPFVQTPFTWHWSVGEHAEPGIEGAFEQDCAFSLHTISVHGGAVMSQVFAGPPTHTPASEQASLVVQKRPSSHTAPVSGTTVHSPTVPGNCPSLHTAFRQAGVSIALQSCAQGLEPPDPPDPPAELAPVPPVFDVVVV